MTDIPTTPTPLAGLLLTRPGWLRYGAAVGLVLLAAALRALLTPHLGTGAPLMLWTLAIVATALVAGPRPGYAATALAALLAHVAYGEPGLQFASTGEALRLAIFVLTGTAISALMGRLHADRANALEVQRSLRDFADSIPDIAWIAAPDGANRFMNRRFDEYTGAGPGGDRLAQWRAAIHPDDWPAARAKWREALATGAGLSTEVRLRRADGEWRWHLVRTVPQCDQSGAVRRWFGTATDVDDARRHAEALGESERRFRLMADSSPFIVWVHDESGALRFVNRVYLEYFGVREIDVYGAEWQPLVHPDDRDAYVAGFEAAMREGREFRGRCRVRRRDGAWRWIESRARMRPAAEGRFRGCVGSSVDVTEQVEALERLQDDDRRKDEFIATLAHELRNPLGPIRTAAHALGDPRLDPAGQRAAAAMIERQSNHMARLLDDLLDVSRITRGRLQLRRQPVELGAAVREALDAVRPALDAKGHTVDLQLPATPAWVDADPTRLAQIVGNLLANAVKYTDPGGHVAVATGVDGDRAWLRVRDDGIGIAPEMLPRLFRMFSQAEPALERSEGGLGIGLALISGLVELHGGTVTARSDGPGRGAEFEVRLPLAARPAAAVPAPGPAASAARPARVLVVDDNVDAAASLAMLLSLEGHAVRVAHRGLDALAQAAREPPDAVVLDIGLPDLPGYEVARRLRAEPWGRSCLLVAATGWGQEQDRRRARDAGFDHHLTKPVDPGQLAALLAGRGSQSRPAPAAERASA